MAVDRDGVYSQTPATVQLQIVAPFYKRASFLIPTVSGGAAILALLMIQAVVLFKRRQRIRTYEREAARELQEARRVQMGLMPQTAPEIEGLEIAGKRVSANTVSGDFYDYFLGKQEGKSAWLSLT